MQLITISTLGWTADNYILQLNGIVLLRKIVGNKRLVCIRKKKYRQILITSFHAFE